MSCLEAVEMASRLSVGMLLSKVPNHCEPPQRVYLRDVLPWKRWAFYALRREANRRRISWRDSQLWRDLAEAACVEHHMNLLVRHIDPTYRMLFCKTIVTRIERALRTWDGQDVDKATYKRRLRHLSRQKQRYRTKEPHTRPFDPLELDVMHSADVEFFTSIILTETDAACRARYSNALQSLTHLYKCTTERYADQWNPALRKKRVRRRVHRHEAEVGK